MNNPYRSRLIALAVAVLSGDNDQATDHANDAIELITNEPGDHQPKTPPATAPTEEPSWLDVAEPDAIVNGQLCWTCPVCNKPRTRAQFTFRRAVRTKCVNCYGDSRRASLAARKRPQISLPGLAQAVAQ